MAYFDRVSRNNNSTYWSGTAGILAVQLAILFALFVAALAYVNWSSNAAVAEFMAAGKPSASEPSYPGQLVPVQQVKSRTVCPRRV